MPSLKIEDEVSYKNGSILPLWNETKHVWNFDGFPLHPSNLCNSSFFFIYIYRKMQFGKLMTWKENGELMICNYFVSIIIRLPFYFSFFNFLYLGSFTNKFLQIQVLHIVFFKKILNYFAFLNHNVLLLLLFSILFSIFPIQKSFDICFSSFLDFISTLFPLTF